ncbi:MAG: copper amine oxidase N-terminal domain-containing protein [Bacillota bacterium]
MMIKRMKPALAATAVLVVLTSMTAFAAETAPVKVQDPAPVSETINADGTITLEGVVEYVDLEGGYYKVGDWSLMGEMEFASYLGKKVKVSGKEFEGMSIRMVKSLVVDQLSLVEEEKAALQEPVTVDGEVTLEGKIEYTDLEGGFYTVNGWGLIGDEALFQGLAGKQVIVRGKEFTGVSIRQVKQVEVASLILPVPANHAQPTGITVNGNKLPAGQDAVVMDGVLMVPLRFVVEKAGGHVQWDPTERMVTATMPDRMAWFWVDQSEAEMNENNVRYITRNMISMTKAPVIIHGRTMISADALTRILGLYEIADTNTTLDLAPLN